MLRLDIAGTGKDKGKTFHLEADEKIFLGMKIGDTVQGKDISADLEGYELVIMGASDKSGFSAFAELEGVGRKKLLLKYGKGMRQRKPKGMRKRKTVRGNTIAVDIAQINLKVKKEGKKTLGEIFPEQAKNKEEKQEIKEETKAE